MTVSPSNHERSEVEILRTPDEQFEHVPDFPYDPNYREVDAGDGQALRVHYVDEGPRDAPSVLMLHGEPTWSFLYRKMIPVVAGAGLRVLAPDLVGFGRSDKPAAMEDYTYSRHVDWMLEWMRQLDLGDITLVAQDWGGLIGLRLLAAEPDRFSRVVVANTGLPTGHGEMSEAFLSWREYSRRADPLPVGRIIQGGTVTELPEPVVAAYDAPFPDERYKAGAKIFPSLVPVDPSDPAGVDNAEAWKVLRTFERPFLTAFSDSDPITAGGDKWFREQIPGARGLDHPTITGAGHFLQEDRGQAWARIIVDFVGATP